MSEKPPEKVVVTVDDGHLSSIESVADELRIAGLHVSSVLATVGVISGEVAMSKLNALKSVRGVTDVEPDQEMRAI